MHVMAELCSNDKTALVGELEDWQRRGGCRVMLGCCGCSCDGWYREDCEDMEWRYDHEHTKTSYCMLRYYNYYRRECMFS